MDKLITEQEVDQFWEVLCEKYGEVATLEKFASKAQLRFLFSKEPKIATSWIAKHKKGEIERLPNRKHPRDASSPKRKVPEKYRNKYKSVNTALKSLGDR